MPSPCPTPHKAKYRDEVAAKVALAKVQRQDKAHRPKTEQRAYRCGRHWHLTSKARRKPEETP